MPHLRIVQVSAAKYGVEQVAYVKHTTGRLWWRKSTIRTEWKPWGEAFDLKKYAGYVPRIGPIYGAMTRRYFNSVAAAEAYIEESRKPYPIVVKDPA